MEDIEEKRQSLRIDMESDKIVIDWLDDQHKKVAEATCVDLSRRGVLFVYSEHFALGSLLHITFNPHNDSRYTVKGQVCRSTNIGHIYQIAVQLIDLN